LQKLSGPVFFGPPVYAYNIAIAHSNKNSVSRS